MKLLTVGDSFTVGEELDDFDYHAWPQLLASQINYELVNHAQTSASNDNILRKTIDYVISAPVDLVVIGWTNIGRSEYADEFGYYDVWPGYLGVIPRDGYNWRNRLIDYISRYHNSEAIHRKFIQQVILLQSFLKSRNIKYVMLNTVQNEYYKKKYFDGQLEYFNQVDKETFLGFNDSGMLEWADGCKKGPGGHFLEDGHQIVAKKINEHIRNLGWVS